MFFTPQVKRCAVVAREAVRDGMCVVIGLQSTGEANTESVKAELGEDGLDDFVSAPHITMRRCARPPNPKP